MRRRARKLLGTTIAMVFVPTYALLTMALAQARPVREAPTLVQDILYVVFGFGWVLPMMPLIRWMERPDDEKTSK